MTEPIKIQVGPTDTHWDLVAKHLCKRLTLIGVPKYLSEWQCNYSHA